MYIIFVANIFLENLSEMLAICVLLLKLFVSVNINFVKSI